VHFGTTNRLADFDTRAIEIADRREGTLIATWGGDDVIADTNAAGTDSRLDGGAGLDIATYAGPAAQYRLGPADDGEWHVTRPGNVTDTLANIERLQFSDKTVNVASATPQWSYSGVPEALYHFFIVAFGAAPGVTYMDQLAEAYWHFSAQPAVADPVKAIVDIFTTKHQFTDLYPDLTDLQVRTNLVEDIVKTSASAQAKAQAVADIGAALGIGWTAGDVIYRVFGNLANKPLNDPQWGGTALQFAKEIEVARYYTEVLHQSTDDVGTLRDVMRPVTEASDVSTPEAIVELIGQALLDG